MITQQLVNAHLIVVYILCQFNSVTLETEFKKLGSHHPPSSGATVLSGKFPPPGVLYYHFVQASKPLLMKNVLGELNYPAFTKWTDEYLVSNYGHEVVDIERGKKENRDNGNVELSLSQFIQIYSNNDLYMVHTAPETMHDDILVPNSLSCGGFQNNLQESVIWFSGGDTKSVLHYDLVDNINCLMDGKKQLVLIDKAYAKLIEKNGWVDEGLYSQVDVDNIDPELYPGILKAPWYKINMEKGDCVYIPYKWYHHVYSPPGRNLAVNLWFNHIWWFNVTDCKNVSNENLPLSQWKIASPNEQLRSEFLSTFAEMKEVTREIFIQGCGCDDAQDAVKIWDLMNKNKDEHLTWDELYSFSIEEIVGRFPQCFQNNADNEKADEFMRDTSVHSQIVEDDNQFEDKTDDSEIKVNTQTNEDNIFLKSNELEDELKNSDRMINKEESILTELKSEGILDTVSDITAEQTGEDITEDDVKNSLEGLNHEEL